MVFFSGTCCAVLCTYVTLFHYRVGEEWLVRVLGLEPEHPRLPHARRRPQQPVVTLAQQDVTYVQYVVGQVVVRNRVARSAVAKMVTLTVTLLLLLLMVTLMQMLTNGKVIMLKMVKMLL